MLIAVTGHTGQVVTSLKERAAASDIEIAVLGRPELDLADASTIRSAMASLQADVIVNAAAYTAVDKAESERELAMRVNGAGAGLVAACAADLQRPVIHLSTDYVFDGSADRPYREEDATAPTGVYGVSKLAGERAVAEANPAHIIVRTAWVYSPFGRNFVKTMLTLGETHSEVSVVADQHGAPTSAIDVADGIIWLARALVANRDSSHYGIYHMTGAGEATWADFAAAIFAYAAENGRPPVRVKRIATSDYPTPAKRPFNSRLNTSKVARTFNIELPLWQVSLRSCVDRLLTQS